MEDYGKGLSRDRSRITMHRSPEDLKKMNDKNDYDSFLQRNWSLKTKTLLVNCRQSGISREETERQLLEKCYMSSPDFLSMLAWGDDTDTSGSGSLDYTLDSNVVCNMSYVNTPGSTLVTVTWYKGTDKERVENWSISFARIGRKILRDEYYRKKVRGFTFIGLKNSTPHDISAPASACRTATLREMRACLASWDDALS